MRTSPQIQFGIQDIRPATITVSSLCAVRPFEVVIFMTVFLPLDPSVGVPTQPSFLLPSHNVQAQLSRAIQAIMKAKRIVVICGSYRHNAQRSGKINNCDAIQERGYLYKPGFQIFDHRKVFSRPSNVTIRRRPCPLEKSYLMRPFST